ncbi:MAG: VOC family protein [Polyangiaceae bacterium]|nr:VOC family protein [Polyangiaceae bacterium]
MGVHHIAITTRDLANTHRFYSDITGFRLVKVEVAPYAGSKKGGWAKHAFYEISPGRGALLAVWELHDEDLGDRYRTEISTALGLPVWANHIAFDAPLEGVLAEKRDRWLEHGLHVTEVIHDFCRSIYTVDPSGILVEFCHTTRPFTDDEIAGAERLLRDPSPPIDPAPPVTHHRPPRPPVKR